MTLDDLEKSIRDRIEEIKKISPETDEAELYLQGCREELQRLLSRIPSRGQ
jgi:hypothetical protein